MTGSEPSQKSLFLAALEIQSEVARAEFLQKACHGNNELRQEVESLLEAHGDPPQIVRQICGKSFPKTRFAASSEYY